MNKIQYCWDNDIKIYPVPVARSNGHKRPNCKIEIDYQGNKRQGTEIYKQNTKLYAKITELYNAYYEKLS
jgi:hypothetical protein